MLMTTTCSKQIAEYGSWVSPIKPELLLGKSVGLGEIQYFSNSIYWIEMRPEEQGRYVIVKRDSDGKQQDMIAAPYNARTRVHEYGGASYLVCEAGIFFTNFSDQYIYWIGHDLSVSQLTKTAECRYADFIYDSSRHRLIGIREDHREESTEANNSIVAIDLNTTDETVLSSGNDFYANPRLSPDSKKICWIEWQHPNMPWDTTSLYQAIMHDDGTISETTLIAGGSDESVLQPKWNQLNELFYVSDKNNWWNIYKFDGDKHECLLAMDAEFAVPQWSFGEQNYDFINNNTLVVNYWLEGVAKLAIVDIEKSSLNDITIPYTDLESIVCHNRSCWFIAASPSSFPAIIELELDNFQFESLRISNEMHIDGGYFSEGESIRYAINQTNEAYAFFYKPENKDFSAPIDSLPPLIVMSHGGPTGASHNGLKMVIQYFTSRGFAVMDVNYGGSTGYGREYRQRLYGEWGIVDVNDCCEAARYAVDQGWADPEQLAIRGGSAGGYTTLASLVFKNVFKAGASHYGVSDLEALANETHKFESRYLDQLIGPYPEEKSLYQQRSPVYAVEQLSCPIIFFQGLEDKIVLPNQAEMMVAALKEKKIPVAYIAYENEQHGFRQSKNIKRTLEAEYYFYSTIFGFECIDDIEPVVFEQ
ncbi:MAG: S9 family peptidase [Pseudomonadota bacterium]